MTLIGGVTPFLSTFWPFWAKVAQTSELPGPPERRGLGHTSAPLTPTNNQPPKKLWSAYGIRNLWPAGPKFCKYWALTEELPLRRNLDLALTYVAERANDLYPMPRKPPIGTGTVIETPRHRGGNKAGAAARRRGIGAFF